MIFSLSTKHSHNTGNKNQSLLTFYVNHYVGVFFFVFYEYFCVLSNNRRMEDKV